MKLKLPQGFHELLLTFHGGTSNSTPLATFGVVSMPAFAHPTADARWAVDASLSWLCRRPCASSEQLGLGGSCSLPCPTSDRNKTVLRSQMVDMLVRTGIAIARERLSTSDIKATAPLPWKWNGQYRNMSADSKEGTFSNSDTNKNRKPPYNEPNPPHENGSFSPRYDKKGQ